jgi:hypothetical protein
MIVLWSDTSALTIFKPISWGDYHPIGWRFSDALQNDDIFHGVIHHIQEHSDRQYNRAEMTLEYSSRVHGSNPTAILDPTSGECFESGPDPNGCLVVTFHRVRVRPFALILQSGQWKKQTVPQWCFVFQGFDPKANKWVVLSERMNDFRPWFNWKGYMIDTGFAFRKFRFLYTGALVFGAPSFSLRAFEIHGTVFPDEYGPAERPAPDVGREPIRK